MSKTAPIIRRQDIHGNIPFCKCCNIGRQHKKYLVVVMMMVAMTMMMISSTFIKDFVSLMFLPTIMIPHDNNNNE